MMLRHSVNILDVKFYVYGYNLIIISFLKTSTMCEPGCVNHWIVRSNKAAHLTLNLRQVFENSSKTG